MHACIHQVCAMYSMTMINPYSLPQIKSQSQGEILNRLVAQEHSDIVNIIQSAKLMAKATFCATECPSSSLPLKVSTSKLW